MKYTIGALLVALLLLVVAIIPDRAFYLIQSALDRNSVDSVAPDSSIEFANPTVIRWSEGTDGGYFYALFRVESEHRRPMAIAYSLSTRKEFVITRMPDEKVSEVRDAIERSKDGDEASKNFSIEVDGYEALVASSDKGVSVFVPELRVVISLAKLADLSEIALR